MSKMDLTPIKGLNSYFGRKMTKNATLEIQKKQHTVVNDLKDKTPVDTGRAQRGWYSYNTTQGYTIKNDVDYISDLNEGTSTQAPRNFIELTLMRHGKLTGPVQYSEEVSDD